MSTVCQGTHMCCNTYQLVAQKLWQHKQTSPSGFALGIGSITAIIPGHPVDNFYIKMVDEIVMQHGDFEVIPLANHSRAKGL